MSETMTNALLAVYPNQTFADAAVSYLQRMAESNVAQSDPIAVVAKDFNGELRISPVGGSSGSRGAKRGAVAGIVVGLMFPPSVVGSVIAGGAIGGIAGNLRGRSGHETALREMGERLPDGHAGVIVLADDEWVDAVAGLFTGNLAVHRYRIDSNMLVAQGDDADSGGGNDASPA
jgi:uncharacterized membrane protein